jgi:hypothetical protein
MKKAIGYTLEILGLAGLSYAGYVLVHPLGYFLGAVSLLLIGLGLGARP